MRYDDMTIVFQGRWTDCTPDNIATARRAYPGAGIVLSTWESHRRHAAAAPVDSLVFSADPGALAPYKLSPHAPENNTNRQIVSTAAGLASVTTRIAVKLRTDCALQCTAARQLFDAVREAEPARTRILACSFYTLHPRGIEALPFHVSDWFQLGSTADLKRYWSLPLLQQEDATWFQARRHKQSASYFVRQYRARFAPEQFMSVAYAASKGYAVPQDVDDRSPLLAAESERFLGNEFVICAPQALGLSLPKYARVSTSHYQFFNCVSGADWLGFRSGAALPDPLAKTISGGVSSPVRHRVAGFFRRIDPAIPFIKRCGLMPVIGNALAFFR